MQSPSFTAAVSHLTQDQNPRVWSLLISVFGDLAQDEGSQVSGALLSQLTEKIGIKPEAMRVAIHRLRKEGWIDSQRIGRNSVYFLTPWGRAQSAQATPRIYADGPAADHAWLAVFNPSKPVQGDTAAGTWVSSNVLVTAQQPASLQAFVTPLTAQTAVPDWISAKICERQTLQMCEGFAAALCRAAPQLAPVLPPLEVAALRVLVVHGWRRIILKTPLLPDHVFAKGWAGPQCREMVAALLAQYPTPRLDTLEAAAKDVVG